MNQQRLKVYKNVKRDRAEGPWKNKERGETPYQHRSFATSDEDVLSKFDPTTKRVLVLFCQPTCAKTRKGGSVAMFEPVHSYACAMFKRTDNNPWEIDKRLVINQAVHPEGSFDRTTKVGKKTISTPGITGPAVYLTRASTSFFDHKATRVVKDGGTAIPTLAICLDIDFFEVDTRLIIDRLKQMKRTKGTYHTEEFSCSHAVSFALTGSYKAQYFPPQVVMKAIALDIIGQIEANGIVSKEQLNEILDHFHRGMDKTRIGANPLSNAHLANELFEIYQNIEEKRSINGFSKGM